MAMIDIEYRHSDAPIDDPTIRRRTTSEMSKYIRDLIFEMQMADISCKFTETVADGPNTVLINGRTIPEIIEGLEIKLLDAEESCDLGSTRLVSFGRPTLDWRREHVEDVPDTIMKNAIAKVFADMNRNNIPLVDN
ncbi:MAG: hypothetical protein IJ026_03150 [Candidatus Methanomethylophilaceae archaeon]|nr:hypothetical protein [Candidatus Methanomethylophilaceae archaeon]